MIELWQVVTLTSGTDLTAVEHIPTWLRQELLALEQAGNMASAIDSLLSKPDRPTAIIADNDEMAFAALHVADRLDMSVPTDLSVVSFEDTPGVRFSVPPLTAIRQPTAAMIAKACDRLIAISHKEKGNGSFEIPFELIRRASTGPSRA